MDCTGGVAIPLRVFQDGCLPAPDPFRIVSCACPPEASLSSDCAPAPLASPKYQMHAPFASRRVQGPDGRQQVIADIHSPLSLYPLAANYSEEVMGGIDDCTRLPRTSASYSALEAELGGQPLELAGPAVFAWAPADDGTAGDLCTGYTRVDVCGDSVAAQGPEDPATVEAPVDRWVGWEAMRGPLLAAETRGWRP